MKEENEMDVVANEERVYDGARKKAGEPRKRKGTILAKLILYNKKLNKKA